MEYRSNFKYSARTVHPEELFPGEILWLPQRFYEDQSIYCSIHTDCHIDTNFSIREGIYRHPIVVLKIWQRPGSQVLGDLMVCFTDMTTFDKTPLKIHATCQHLIKFAMSTPIRQTTPQPDEPFMLDLATGSESLIGQCYVRRQHAWVIPACQLWTYRWIDSHAYSVRLFRDSYYWLATQIGIEPEIYEDISTSLANARQKLAWLAGEEGRNIDKNTTAWKQDLNDSANQYQQNMQHEVAMAPQVSFLSPNIPRNWEAAPSFQNPASMIENQNYTHHLSTSSQASMCFGTCTETNVPRSWFSSTTQQQYYADSASNLEN